jgi:hypothetical protein
MNDSETVCTPRYGHGVPTEVGTQKSARDAPSAAASRPTTPKPVTDVADPSDRHLTDCDGGCTSRKSHRSRDLVHCSTVTAAVRRDRFCSCAYARMQRARGALLALRLAPAAGARRAKLCKGVGVVHLAIAYKRLAD